MIARSPLRSAATATAHVMTSLMHKVCHEYMGIPGDTRTHQGRVLLITGSGFKSLLGS